MHAKTSLPCFQVAPLEITTELCFGILLRDVFLCMVCRFPLSRFDMRLLRNGINAFGQEKKFAFGGKRLEHFEGSEFLCVHRPKTINVSTGRVQKVSIQRIHCLYKSVIYCLYAAKN